MNLRPVSVIATALARASAEELVAQGEETLRGDLTALD